MQIKSTCFNNHTFFLKFAFVRVLLCLSNAIRHKSKYQGNFLFVFAKYEFNNFFWFALVIFI